MKRKMTEITLITNDNQEFKTSEEFVNKCKTISNLIEDVGTDNPIPLLEVNSEQLESVLKFYKDEDFSELSQSYIFELILVSNYLEYSEMLDYMCKMIVDMIKGKSVEEIRKCFNIENDFTSEEYAQVEKENSWLVEQ